MNPQSTLRSYDLVICDIDGCLSSEGPTAFDVASLSQIATYNQRAITEKDRPQLTFCTGRPLPYAESICRLLQNLSIPCIAENGVWMYHPGTNEYVMDPAISEEDLQAVQEAETWIRREFGPQGLTIQPGKSASVSLYCVTHERTLEMLPIVREACRSHGWPLHVTNTWLYLNCDLHYVSKASGIRRLLERVEIDKSRLAGIGDTLGDLTIAQSVAWFGCPANAAAEIQPHAQYVSPYPEAVGVLDILTQITGLV